MKARKIRLDRIYAENLGPVRRADIKIGDVTVLMGPNNTGKTYTAMLTLLAESLAGLFLLVPDFNEMSDSERKSFVRLNAFNYILDTYSLTDASKLIRQGADTATVKFIFEKIEARTLTNPTISLDIDKDGKLRPWWDPVIWARPKQVVFIVPSSVVYLPAERAGIMKTYRQLLRLHLRTRWIPTSVLLREKKRLVTLLGEEIEMHRTIREFLDQLLAVGERKKGVDIEVAYLEENVLGGKVELREDLSVKYFPKEIKEEIDIINSSSLIAEVSGIYLMSSLAGPGDFLVVEEPESHVHPRGQLALARFFAKLANKGVRVFITTHSDLIALKLAQLVGLNGLSTEQLKKLGYDESDRLSKERLSIYFMKPTPEGSVSEEIQVSETGEVEELPTYSHVIEEMYGEAVKLLDLHRKISEPPY
ncbi:MAG: AAA family ATPase [Candidatus Caldarchaeum sp.]